MIDHREFLRDVENCHTAVLMIHGIAGTPAHFRKLTDIIPEEWTLHNILLDGHGKGVLDFGNSSMKKWREQIKAKVSELLRLHENVFIVAHSMGTLFAIQAAIDHPDKVAGLFLLSVPTRPWVRFSTVRTSMKAVMGKTGDDVTRMLNDTSITLSKKLWQYTSWAPRLVELLFEMRRIRKILPELKVSTQTFQSQMDELVSARSVKDLEKHPAIQNTVLYHSGHFDYGDEDIALLRERLSQTIDEIKNKDG